LPLNVRLEPSFRATQGGGRLVTLEEVEARYILRVVEECNGRRQEAAEILGISERNLYRKLKDLDAVKKEDDALLP
jgi:two-component system response regulator AtoC